MRKIGIMQIIIIIIFIVISFKVLVSLPNIFNKENINVACLEEVDCAIQSVSQEFIGTFDYIENNIVYFEIDNDTYSSKLVLTEDYDNEYLSNLLIKGDRLKVQYEYIEDGTYYSWIYLVDENEKEFLLQELLLKNNKVNLIDTKGIEQNQELANKLINEYPEVPTHNSDNNSNIGLLNLFSLDSIGNSTSLPTSKSEKKEEEENVEELESAGAKELADNQLITIEPCDLSGEREPNVKVDIGMDTPFATRNYYAYTNENSQLVYVSADEIILQNDKKESEYLKGDGRYCSDEAKVSGTEDKYLDEGHAIADSLGGVSNAYNITPQDSTLNRSGVQYDMEEDIRKAEATGENIVDFQYWIYYPNDETMIPSSYKVSYSINGWNEVITTFDNVSG